MTKEVSEEVILRVFVEEMEVRGENRKLVELDVDDEFVDKINSANGVNVSLEQVRLLTDRCLENKWLEQTTMGGKYVRLSLTTTGLGVVRSRQRKKEALAKRTSWKTASDYMEDHKGLFLVLSALIALIGLFVHLFAG